VSLVGTAVRRPIGTAVLAVGVFVVGLVASQRLAVDLLPAVDFPRISVVTQYEGVGPEEMETLVTRPIEQSVATVEGIERIESESAEGISRIQLQFAWGTSLDTAVNDVRANLGMLDNVLPDDARRPVVMKFDLAAMPIATVGVSGGGDPRHLRYLAEETLTRRLEKVPGAANVNVRGGRVREIQVNLDPARLVALNVSAQEVAFAVARDNADVSAGDVRADGQQVLVRSLGEWERVADIRDVLVARREGRPVYVRDLATVADTIRRITSDLWVDGQPGIVLSVAKQSGANTVAVVDALRREVERINQEYAGRVSLHILRDSSGFIRRSVSNVQTSALLGAALALAVLLVFLRNARATLVIGVAIPLSVLAALGLMYLSGFTLNVISFGGLALGIGMLVDNGIVILENIHRKREEGVPVVRACIEGASEMVPAVLAGTLTTAVVFAPVVFLGGFAGVFFGEMAAVVSFALFCSLLVAVTLVPSLGARLLGARVVHVPRPLHAAAEAVGRALGGLERGYTRVVAAALRAPWFVLALAVLALAASAALLPRVGFELMPETDEGQAEVDVEFAVGTPIEQSARFMADMERRARSALDPDDLQAIVNSAGPEAWWRTEGANAGELEIYLRPASERAHGMPEILRALRQVMADVPDADLRIRQGSSNFLMRIVRGGQDERLVVEVRGHDRETAAALADRVQAALRAVPGVTHAYRDEEQGLGERAVRVDAARAAEFGLSRDDVARTLETYVLGRVVTRYREGGYEFDVRVQLGPDERRQAAQLERLPVALPGGGAVPLAAVAHLEPRTAPRAITRQDQERVVRVLGATGDRALGAVVADVRAALADIAPPEGFTLALGGEQAQQEETFGGLLVGILLALFLVYTVMAVQFESLRDPLVIMVSVPFAFIGAVSALALTGTTFNLYSFLGAIVLVGIVVNNAIVLVDTANRLRRAHGLPLVAAITGAAVRRLRPILMTTLTTVLAMLPLALNVGEGSEVQAPLARVVVGGLTSSTLVTLVVVPCVYLLAERRRAGAPARAPSPAAPPAPLGAS
jgi:HAE1 family hydrophobic/amphiphilic exporter-1